MLKNEENNWTAEIVLVTPTPEMLPPWSAMVYFQQQPETTLLELGGLEHCCQAPTQAQCLHIYKMGKAISSHCIGKALCYFLESFF